MSLSATPREVEITNRRLGRRANPKCISLFRFRRKRSEKRGSRLRGTMEQGRSRERKGILCISTSIENSSFWHAASITPAFENCIWFQPLHGKHIVALEREFNAELFIRDRRNVQLSEAGRILFGCAMEIVDAYDRAQAAIATVVKERPIRVDGILYDNTVSSIISLSTVLLNDQRHVPILFDHHEGRPLFEQLEQAEVWTWCSPTTRQGRSRNGGWFSDRSSKPRSLPSSIKTTLLQSTRKSA